MRGTGWVEEPIDAIGAVDEDPILDLLPNSGGVTREPWILDQGQTNSCTGHNGVQLVYGLTGDRCSPWFPWFFGRMHDGEKLPPRNVGVRSSSMLRALRNHGTVLHEHWCDGVPGFRTNKLPPGLLRQRAQKHNVDVAAINASGGALVDRIVNALAQGLPCGLVVRVDEAFERARENVVGRESGSIRGLHIITPWRFVMDGGYVISCVNSWGRGHGDSGIVHLSAERVAQAPFACIAKGVS
jgi:hypothetical protein